MPEYLDISGGTDEVRATGANIQAAGAAAAAKAEEIRNRIESLEAQAPWGADEYGASIQRNYTQPVGGGTPFNELLKDSLRTTGPDVADVGTNVSGAMNDYQSVELQNYTDIGQARP